MVRFFLNEAYGNEYRDAGELLAELRHTQTQPIFRTYIPDGQKKIIFCTTNEKVHLALGKLTDPAQEVLARLFEEKIKVGGELVFTHQPMDDTPPSRSLVVTASRDARNYRTFHLSSGH